MSEIDEYDTVKYRDPGTHSGALFLLINIYFLIIIIIIIIIIRIKLIVISPNKKNNTKIKI